MKKRILIIGLAGYNLGDEAIAVASARFLSDSHDLIITSVRPGSIAQYGIKEVLLDRRSIRSWVRLVKEIRSADMVLIGGGSLIQDKLGIGIFRGVLSFFLQSLILCRVVGTRIATLPIGVDALETRLGRNTARLALKLLEEINVRDRLSAKIVEGITPAPPKTLLYADPAYMLQPAKIDDAEQRGADQVLLVSLVRENIEIEVLKSLHAEIRGYAASNNLQVRYISMDRRFSDEESLYRDILDIPATEIIKPDNLTEVFHAIEQSECIIAMRLHLLILALGRKPLIGISRTTKTRAFCTENMVPYVELGAVSDNIAELNSILIEDSWRSADRLIEHRLRRKINADLAARFFDDLRC